MKEHRTQQRERDDGDALGISALVCVLLGAVFFWIWASPLSERSPLDFPAIQVDRAELEKARERRYGDAWKAAEGSEALSTLIDAVRKANARQFEESDDSSSEDSNADSDLSAEIRLASNNVITSTGYDGYIASGRPVFEACRRGLETLLQALRRGDISWDAASSVPPKEQFEAYRRNCGALLPRLVEWHLIDQKGRWRSPAATSRAIFSILQRYRWAFNIERHKRPLLQLTSYERTLLLRWRIQNGEAFSPQQRHAFLETIEDSPDRVSEYDVYLARARLAYDLKNYDAAARALQTGLEEGTSSRRTYRRALDWLRGHRPN